jgi:uracil-DNA glycosylase
MTGLPTTPKDFKHGASYRLGEGLPWLVASYHPSRQNTQTGRLTEAMFDDVWIKAKECLMS